MSSSSRDSRFSIPDYRLRIPDYRFQKKAVSGFEVPDFKMSYPERILSGIKNRVFDKEQRSHTEWKIQRERKASMMNYLVFDIETRVDKDLVKEVYDPENSLTLEQAYDTARDQILERIRSWNGAGSRAIFSRSRSTSR
jgi:hypothetical protein